MRALRMFGSSVGTKVVLAFTGLSLFGFLLVHLYGNLLAFLGPATYNEHAHALISNPLIIPAELGLLALFLMHVYKAIANYLSNRDARPEGYGVKKWAGGPSRKSVGSSTMIWTGLATLLFVAVHLKTFKYGPVYTSTGEGGIAERDLYRLFIEVFQHPVMVVAYIISMVLLGLHLRHGISSSMQSLGIMPESKTGAVLRTGLVLAVVIAGLFAILPVVVFFGLVR
jgi:succinate dehydrogenase / fumarate reductase, cytochrome b subunit